MVSAKIAKAINSKSKLLNLSGLRLKSIPSEVAKIKSLEILNLGDNKIKDLRPLGYLPNLKVIYLDSNQIEFISPDFFDSLDLNVLNLSGNHIQDIPDSISNQKNLRRLFLSSNKISFIPESLSELESLEYFSLGNNQLSFIPSSINKLKNLQSFSAYDNQITEIQIDFAELKNLTHLSLANNEITELPTSLSESKSLKSLQVYSNDLKTFPNLENTELPQCRMNLGDNKIEEIHIKNGNLDRLHLYFNPLIGNQLELVKQAKINHLYIDNSQAKKFIVKGRTMKCIKIINNEKMEINSDIYKTVPESIEEKYGLKSRRQQLRERLDSLK